MSDQTTPSAADQAIDDHFEKFIKAPSYEELVPLGRTWHFSDPDEPKYDENGEEREADITLTEAEIARDVASNWRMQLEACIDEVGDTSIHCDTWNETILLNAEEGLGIGFEDGWHDGDSGHPAAERARHLAEMDLFLWLAKRHGIPLSAETTGYLKEREGRIDRDLSTPKGSS